MDNYQAVYDAIRSRITGCDVSSVIERAARQALDLGIVQLLLQQEIANVGYQLSRPSAVWRPRLYLDGDQWCALYGADIQSGIAGFGHSPEDAMTNFDKAWHASTATTAAIANLAPEQQQAI